MPNNVEAERKKEQFKNNVLPILAELKKVCRRYDMPMFCTVCYYTGIKPDEDEKTEDIIPIQKSPEYQSEYINDFVSPASVNIRMQPDYIAECIKIINGFHAVSSLEDVFDMNDLSIPDGQYYDPKEIL